MKEIVAATAENAEQMLPEAWGFDRSDLTLDEYQNIIGLFDRSGLESYGNGETPLWYYMLGLAGETGELVDKIKKLYRNNQSDQIPDEAKRAIALEFGDILWYLSRAAAKLGMTMSDVATFNVQKLADRARRNVIRSEGDNR